MSQRESVLQFEDDRMKVNTLTFEKRGDETGVHIHAADYLVVPISGGDLKVVRPDGTETEMHQQPGVTT